MFLRFLIWSNRDRSKPGLGFVLGMRERAAVTPIACGPTQLSVSSEPLSGRTLREKTVLWDGLWGESVVARCMGEFFDGRELLLCAAQVSCRWRRDLLNNA